MLRQRICAQNPRPHRVSCSLKLEFELATYESDLELLQIRPLVGRTARIGLVALHS